MAAVATNAGIRIVVLALIHISFHSTLRMDADRS
jgi:hypothetical protein